MAIDIPPIPEEDLATLQQVILDNNDVVLSDMTAQSLINRIRQLEGAVRGLLTCAVPHTRDTGHNAADREMSEAIKAARAAVPD